MIVIRLLLLEILIVVEEKKNSFECHETIKSKVEKAQVEEEFHLLIKDKGNMSVEFYGSPCNNPHFRAVSLTYLTFTNLINKK